ncbi:MAG TPA: methylthioribulose 1-phosphate dehydratase [Verrucomicrobiae bacterium]|nr:methylthioribulose 1-phosphate dehydratase [Verrucomicrobiae bacterium]
MSGSVATPVPSPEAHIGAIDELTECGREFHRRGWSLGTSSNYSVVVQRDPLTLLMTGSGFDKGRLEPSQFVLVDAEGRSLHPSLPKPSAEALIHTTLAHCAGAGAVLHTHSICGTVLSEGFLADGHLVMRGYEMLKGLAGITTHDTSVEVEIFHNTQDIAALAAVVADQLDNVENPLRHGFLIAGHGLYTWGTNLAAARRHVEVFEFLFEVMAQKRLLFGQW